MSEHIRLDPVPAATPEPAAVPADAAVLVLPTPKRRFIGATHRWSLDEVHGRHGSARAA